MFGCGGGGGGGWPPRPPTMSLWRGVGLVRRGGQGEMRRTTLAAEPDEVEHDHGSTHARAVGVHVDRFHGVGELHDPGVHDTLRAELDQSREHLAELGSRSGPAQRVDRGLDGDVLGHFREGVDHGQDAGALVGQAADEGLLALLAAIPVIVPRVRGLETGLQLAREVRTQHLLEDRAHCGVPEPEDRADAVCGALGVQVQGVVGTLLVGHCRYTSFSGHHRP